MVNQPMVSCIVIFYDTEPTYFSDALLSIVAQRFTDYEVILVDDGSQNSETIKVAENFLLAHSGKTVLIRHSCGQNKGMSASRNLGVAHSKGSYITFLDSDDTWEPDNLEDQTNLLLGNPVACMVYGPIRHWYSWREGISVDQDWVDTSKDFVEKPEKFINKIIPPPILFPLLVKNRISISGFMLKRESVLAVGGFEDKFRGLYEDQVFCSKICLHYQILFSDKCWYNYRQHEQSHCSIAYENIPKTWRKGREKFLCWVAEYLVAEQKKYTKEWWMIKNEILFFRYPRLASKVTRINFRCRKISKRIFSDTRFRGRGS